MVLVDASASGPDQEEPDDLVDDESQQDDEGLVDIGESTLKYFGADFDIAGLVRRLTDGDIAVPRFDPDESEGSSLEGFQRKRVWTNSRMEKFIESLLLGWPVPSIFLVLDVDQRYLVLDGQQRLTSLRCFFEGRYPAGREFVLKDVAEHLQGATYAPLNTESKRRLNNTFIQATVVEPAGPEGHESVYRLFGRLNSGGVILTPQEIRVALYRGPIVDWLRKLNSDTSWRSLFGAPHLRLKDHELVLRVMAMREVIEKIDGHWLDGELRLSAYRPPMSEFLNKFLGNHRDLQGFDADGLQAAFSLACISLLRSVGQDGLKYAGRLNAAHVDAALGALTYLSYRDEMPQDDVVIRGIRQLRDSDDYSLLVAGSTSHRESVYGRLSAAVAAFRP